MEYDILSIDTKIKRSLKQESKNLSHYRKRLAELKKTILSDKLSFRVRRSITKSIEEVKNKIKKIETRHDINFYIAETSSYLEKYKKILKTPMKLNFMGRPKNNNKAKKAIIKEYLTVASKYFDIDFEISDSDNRVVCNNCPNKKLFDIIDSSVYICQECGAQQEILLHTSSYKDIDRVNISAKYTYDRKVHFRDCMNQYQGKQNSTIDKKVYEELEKQFELHHLLIGDKKTPKKKRFKNITKMHIHMFLKELDFTKHYENVNLIHYNMTGNKPDDISHLEDRLLDDFDALSDVYHKLFKNKPGFERKNFINTQYVLYQLLMKYHHPCKKEDFTILKTVDRKSFHDNVTSACFQMLGWNLSPIF